MTLGLLDAQGQELPVQLEGWDSPRHGSHPVLTEASRRWCSPASTANPCRRCCAASRPRWFSTWSNSDAQLLTLLAHDTDPFNRWEAGQRLALRRALAIDPAGRSPRPPDPGQRLHRSHAGRAAPSGAGRGLQGTGADLPAETYIAEQLDVVDPQRIHAVREAMREQLAHALHEDWVWAWEQHRENGAYRPIR
jgi:aminopeptidase N